MNALRVIPNVPVRDPDRAREFFGEFLGLGNVDFDLGWVTRLTSPDSEAEVQLVTRDLTAPENSVISVMTDDVDAAYEEARARLRDRASVDHRGLGCAAIPGAVTGRRCRQHRPPPHLSPDRR